MSGSDRTPSLAMDDGSRSLERVDDSGWSRRILLPVGPSDTDRIQSLAATAAETGGMLQASLHVLHVFTPDRFDRICDDLDVSANDAGAPTRVARRVTPVRELARELSTPLRNWGVPMTVDGRIGDDVSDEIVATAADIDAERIFICGRRRTPTGKAVFGSTAQRVLLNAPCPVTFVRDT